MPLYNCPPKEGVYKYVRVCEQLFYGDIDINHKDIVKQEGMLEQITFIRLFSPEDVGAGVFIVHREEVRVVASGSSTLDIPLDGLGADNDLKIFTEKSTPYGFKVSKM